MLTKQHSLSAVAEALEISASGYHAHVGKSRRPRRQQDAQLRKVLAECFAASRQTYGSPRLLRDLRGAGSPYGADVGHRHRDLRERGFGCGNKRGNRAMRETGLRPRHKRRCRPKTTDSRDTKKPAPTWLDRVPAPDRPGQIWQSDFTYIPTGEGWLYLAFTLDAFSRRCVAHHCREDMAVDLVTATLRQALARATPPPGLIHHSDRGSQYAAEAFQARLRAARITPSMSRCGNPYDNALAESFVATLKTECLGHCIPATRSAARLLIFDYIEAFYNPRRRHSSLDFRSPVDAESSVEPPVPHPRTNHQN
jgi:transposase InsO family protein